MNVIDESNIICPICNIIKKDLGYHINKMHNIDKNTFHTLYPGYLLVAPYILAKRTKTITEVSRLLHKEGKIVVSKETRAKHSENSKKYHKKMRDENYENYIYNQRKYAENARKAKGSNYKHSEETINKMRGPRPNSCGKKFSVEHRYKLSIMAKSRKRNPHKPETINKMKETWCKRRENVDEFKKYIQKIKSNWTIEKRVDMSNRVKILISNKQLGPHQYDTKLELKMKDYLSLHDIHYNHQFLIYNNKDVWNFDFYIESMNLLIETDGEYWHSKSKEQINRDIIKEKIAKSKGYRFIRISDDNWIPSLIFESNEIIDANNQNIINKRLNGLK